MGDRTAESVGDRGQVGLLLQEEAEAPSSGTKSGKLEQVRPATDLHI
jgi:hypothetical protein